jgi:hypothetical protein
MTLVIVGLGTAALFAQGVYSPTITEGATIKVYETHVINLGESRVGGGGGISMFRQSAANVAGWRFCCGNVPSAVLPCSLQLQVVRSH